MLRWLAVAVAITSLGFAAEVDSVALLNRLKSGARRNAESIPRFVCRIRIERQDYSAVVNPRQPPPHYCPTIGERDFPEPKEALQTRERANLEVMLSQTSELFAWPGQRRFQAQTPNDLLGAGFSGSGDFASFALGALTTTGVQFQFLGECGEGCVRYRYEVSPAISHYSVRSGAGEVRVGYRGTMDVNPDRYGLRELIVLPMDLGRAMPGVCDLRTRIRYAEAPVESGVFSIPESTEQVFRSNDGSVLRNRIAYEGCSQYSAESTISFDDEDSASGDAADADPAERLPAKGTKLQLRLGTKIDSEKNAAGDAIEATLAKPVKDARGREIAAGTVFRGHVAKMATHFGARGRVLIAVRFDEMLVRGKAIPVAVRGDGETDERGQEMFTVPTQHLVLDTRTTLHERFEGPAKE